jgi:large subunit ribosomal protein L34e
MPEPRYRSRTYRRIRTKLPGGENVLHYKKRTPKAAKCSKCGADLKGIPRLRDYKMMKLGKSKKRVERPFGGNLCSKCSRSLIKEETRIS